MTTVLVFGTFDGLHEGHFHFLKQARLLGDRLVGVIAQDVTAEKLKGKKPLQPLLERISDLQKTGLVEEAVPGDTDLGKWSAIAAYRPHVIALGYDQRDLKQALENFLKDSRIDVIIKIMTPYEPERYHSSLIHAGYQSHSL